MEKKHYQGLINKYREYLPVTDKTPVITLNEGNTPLIKADNLAKKIGLNANVYLKYEHAKNNPDIYRWFFLLISTLKRKKNSEKIVCCPTPI